MGAYIESNERLPAIVYHESLLNYSQELKFNENKDLYKAKKKVKKERVELSRIILVSL